jgi:glycosyltransferase involved in cell wall biosynthesis
MRPIRFIYLGALSRSRDLEPLLFAIQKVLARTDGFRVVFVGPDRAHGFYQSLVNELGLADVVTLMPPVPYEEVPELLANHAVGLAYVPDRQTWHLQPTIKVLEYRAAGLPILSSDVVSHREVVEDGINGMLVPNSAEGLAAGMMQFINDRAFLRQCQLNASKMRQAVTINEVARMYEQDVYQKLVDQGDLQLVAA